MTATILKWGNSQGIRLPKHLLDSLGLSVGDKVDIIVEDGNIVIKKARTYSTIEERFEQYDGGEFHTELVNMGESVGEEKWWEKE